jgi:hypothetical protein
VAFKFQDGRIGEFDDVGTAKAGGASHDFDDLDGFVDAGGIFVILSGRDLGGIVEDLVDDNNQDLGNFSWFYRKR